MCWAADPHRKMFCARDPQKRRWASTINMLKGSQKIPGEKTQFYPMGGLTEVKAGYLYKSPPAKWPNTEKSWKRRFFTLYKISEQEHQLKYFRNAEDRDKHLGEIDLSQIMRLYISPQNHPKWNWVLKNFKCSPACVLFIKTAERDYFLIGENSSEVDEWFSALFDALKYRPHRVFDTEDSSETCVTTPEADVMKQRSMSDPPPSTRCRSMSEPGQGSELPRRPYSEPVDLYDYPRSYLKGLKLGLWKKEAFDDETLDISEENDYMKMEAVYEDIKEGGRDTHLLDIEVKELTEGGSLVKSITKVYDRLKTRMSTEALNTGERGEEVFLTDSSCSRENGTVSPAERSKHTANNTLEKHSSMDSIADMTPEEKDIDVNRGDLKKHLTLTEMDGKPCVSGWTGQPQTMCLFHKGDQILAINDLHTCSVGDFHNYLSKLLKNDVKLTILRLPGCQPLHSVNCLCSDR